MSSSPKSGERDRHPLAAEAGITAGLPYVDDPFARLDELMVVIEALCPTWPRREPFTTSGEWRI